MSACLWAWLTCSAAGADPVWVVEPGTPGPDMPPLGRSLFDHLTTQDGRQSVPFPFDRLLATLQDRLDADGAYLGRPLKQLLIPLGRSLQREAAAPAYFASPRVVVAVDTEPLAGPGESGMLLRDRLYIGYLEAADVLEIISYNEDAARFEFQVVHDYRHGATPSIRYARRAVCTACHQNAAPIFARPLWDETNANADIADRLEAAGRDFYGLPARIGVDVAYAVDNATDRANGFALTQRLWDQGCGAGRTGAGCRAAILTRALQFALSGRHGLEQGAGNSADVPHARLPERFARLWPDGLLLPTSDIPNRKPLQGMTRRETDDTAAAARELMRHTDVAAQFEPLTPRPPETVWTPDADSAVRRTISGIAEFIARNDLRRLDELLATSDAETTTLTADCTVDYRRPDWNGRIKLSCDSPDLSVRGIVSAADADGSLSGRLRDIRLNGEALGSLAVTGHADGQNILRVTPIRTGRPGRVRLASGDALDRLTIARNSERPNRARIEWQIRHDFVRVAETLGRLAMDAAGPLDSGPFVRARVIGGLFDALGDTDIDWCCTGDAGLPMPVVERPSMTNGDPLLAAFFQVCGACHRSDEPFPPNFLAGKPEQVPRGIAQCAERIQYRLAMWDHAPGHRSKSPMPPRQTVGLSDDELETWSRGPLQRLREALYQIAARERMPLPTQDEATARPYAELRACLPTS